MKAYANKKVSTSRSLCIWFGSMTKHGLCTNKVSECRELVDSYSGTVHILMCRLDKSDNLKLNRGVAASFDIWCGASQASVEYMGALKGPRTVLMKDCP